MKLVIKLMPLTILLCSLICCERLTRKADQISERVADKTKQGIARQADKIVDKILPAFDYDKPDTENNKERFRDFLKVEITPDVKDIYCFDDAIGIDADYMFSFSCNSSTSIRIIETNNLKLDITSTDNAFALQHDFEWWNKARIATLKKYSWTNGNRYFKYYWYDKENEKAYFFDFDM